MNKNKAAFFHLTNKCFKINKNSLVKLSDKIKCECNLVQNIRTFICLLKIDHLMFMHSKAPVNKNADNLTRKNSTIRQIQK